VTSTIFYEKSDIIALMPICYASMAEPTGGSEGMNRASKVADQILQTYTSNVKLGETVANPSQL